MSSATVMWWSVGEREDAFAGVGGADPEVVHPAGAAEGHLAFGVEAVIAQAVVAGLVAVARRGGFGGGAVGVAWGSVMQRAVGAPFVVVRAELVQLGLQLGDAARGWRFLGSGLISPASCRTRRIVEVDGALRPSRSRCQRIVSGPASSPSAIRRARSSISLTKRLRRSDRRGLRTARPRVQGVQAALSVTDEEAMEMPAGDPELGRRRGDRQLLGNDLKNSNTRSGHARDCPPTPRQCRARRSPLQHSLRSRLRDDRRSSAQPCNGA